MTLSTSAAQFQSSQFRSGDSAQPASQDSRNAPNTESVKNPPQRRSRRPAKDSSGEGRKGILKNGLSKLALGDSTASGGTGDASNGDGDDGEEVCVICASRIVYYAIPPCNHHSCHVCSLRLRSLYETKACPQCRVPADMVIFTKDAEKRYEDYIPKDITNINASLGVKFTEKEIFTSTVDFLKFNCTFTNCTFSASGWPDLKQHVSRAHQRSFCEICVDNKKVFTDEHEMFTKKGLLLHEKYGETARGSSTEKSGFVGHPECGFCRTRFYGDDELFTHCRRQHERCHICDQTATGGQFQYYANYERLEEHFHVDHFPCTDKECLEKKFVVFGSEGELTSHNIEVHRASFHQSKPPRDVRRGVNFPALADARTPYTQPNRTSNSNSHGGPGGSSRQPEGRPAAAARTVHGAGGARTFGGQLTTRAPEPVNRSASNGQSNQRTANGNSQADTSADRARKTRHEAVLNRVRLLARADESKITEFREMVTLFRQSSVTPDRFIVQLFGLFDAPSSEVGILVRELSDIFEIPDRRDSLLMAWNDWRAVNENFPTLGVAVGTAGSSNGTSSEISRPNWSGSSRTSRVAATEQFPTLSAAVNASRPKTRATPPSWSSTTSAPSGPSRSTATASASASSSTSSVTHTAKKSTGPGSTTGGADTFPSLPSAKKPVAAAFSRGYSGPAVLSHSTFMQMTGTGKSTPNVWRASGPDSGDASGVEAGEGGSKKQTKKKQTLIRFG